MRIAYYQFDVQFGKKEANLEKVRAVLSGHCPDLLVLPELFNTGALFQKRQEAFDMAEAIPEGRSSRFLLRLAREYNLVLIGGILEKEKGCLYNTALVAGPEGMKGKYRKVFPSETEAWFTPGNEFPVFKVKGVLIGIVICNDATKEEAWRQYRAAGVQLLCMPANLCVPSLAEILDYTEKYQIPVLIANRIGRDLLSFPPIIPFCGGSLFLDYTGRARMEAGKGEILRIMEFNPGITTTVTHL